MEPESSKKHKGDADLEVTGVSRSGRVRKKSSKLVDFESPDDIDTSRPKRPGPAQQRMPSHAPQHSEPIAQHHDTAPGHVGKDDHGPEEPSDDDYFDPSLDNPNDSMDSMDSDEGPSDGESHVESPSATTGTPHTLSRPGHSLYMMEKSNKKKLLVKDGRIVGRAKAQRKDKGKTRVTAYMMWAKGVRNDLIKKHPDMDFSAISKRLGEMWANVTYLERYVWKRKAKRYAAMKAEQTTSVAKTVNTGPPPPAKSNAPQSNHQQGANPPIHHTPGNRSRQTSHSKQNNSATGGSGGPGSGGGSAGAGAGTGSSGPGGSGGGGGMYRVVGVGPAEIGAHLRLLGESLTIIGERLKEHEGQIAVSGSVSVLLDTLLCSLAPLVCLTAHIPSIAPPVPLLQDTLDNIAYIMPGL